MSRSGYSDDCDNWSLICWRGAVASAIKGKRGQAFLKEMLQVLDKLKDRTLLSHELVDDYGSVCAIGAVGMCRGINMLQLDPEDPNIIAQVFGVSPALIKEISFQNDEGDWRIYWSNGEHPEKRYNRMRQWVESQIIKEDQK